MGAYLSEPLTTKDSSDESNDYLLSGTSSMQGWRVHQEDAHNCILNFDENVSFFAVYDGHGGAEVARYCSLYMPDFLKTVPAYGQQNFEQALKDAFIGFDATLLKEKVIEVLKQLSDKANCEEEAEEDEEEEEEESDNVEDLFKEAMMPLNDVLQKYRKDTKAVAVPANQRVAMMAKEGNCSKPVSPFLKGKRRSTADADGGDEAGGSSGSSAGSSTASASVEAAAAAAVGAASGGTSDVAETSGEADPAAEDSKPSARGAADAADSTVSSSEERIKETTASVQEPSSSSSSTSPSLPAAEPSASVTPETETSMPTGSASGKKEEQSNEISDTDGIIPVKSANSSAEAAGSPGAAKENCAPDSSSSDGSKLQQQPTSKLNGDVKASASSGAVSSSCTSSSSSAPSDTSVGQENGTVESASTGAAKVHSSSSTGDVKPDAKNGPSAAVDDVPMNDDDTEDDDESDSDEEFPHADEPIDDTSSTEDGEEDPEEASEEDEEGEEEGEYEEEDFMNEEDAAFMKNITEEPGKESGCTAVVALLHGKDLYVANAGDSRCVVCRNGQALEMSFDHKPEDEIEYERIAKAGGRVTMDGRVNGGLNLSRAIGDHGYKMNKALPAEEQMISALPDIQKITIGPEDDFMVLACDGIWNYMSSGEVVQFVLERIHQPGVKLSQICEELFDNCLAPHTKGDGTGCDNMTAIIVQFKPNFAGSASRKRTASESVETAIAGSGDGPAISSAVKKQKTDAAADGASSTTEVDACSNGAVDGKGGEADASEELEAAAAVASIDGSSEAAASSST